MRAVIPLRRLWPLLCLLAAGLLLHVHQLLGERTYFRDVQIFYAPTKHYLTEMLRHHELPQWWPFDGLGTPFLAQPMFSVFHPTTLFYLALPFWKAFAAQDLTGTFLALSGTYLLARALGQPRSSAVLAAVAFAANGYVMGLTEHTFMKLSAGTMPWYLWGLLRALRRGGPWTLVPAAAMGLLLLAGDPQIAILSAGAGLALACAESPSVRALLLAVASPVVGGVLAAVQVLPSLRLIPDTDRATAPHGLHQWPLDLPHLIAMVVPVKTDGFAFHMTLGLAAFALVGASAVAARRDRRIAALFLITLVGLWLALGDDFGLNPLARRLVPIWGTLRYAIKSVVLPMLILSLLAGEGLRQLRGDRRRLAMRWALGTVGVLAATAGLYLRLVFPESDWLTFAATLVPGLALAAFVIAARSPVARGIAVALVCAQLLSFGLDALPTMAPDLYAASPIVNELRRLGVGLQGPAFDRVDDLPRSENVSPRRLTASGGGLNTLYGAMFDLPTLLSYMPATSNRLREAWHPADDPHLLARIAGITGVGYLVVSPGFDARFGPSLVEADHTVFRDPISGFVIDHLARSLPRAYATRRGVPVRSPREAGDLLFGTTFRPGREVLIETDDPHPAWADRPEALAVPVQIAGRTNSSVTLSADLPWDGFVVLNESWFHGWTATLDGQSAPLLVANGFARAVATPAGHHEIRMQFETPGLRAGILISVIGWLALAGAAIVLLRRLRTVPT